MSNIREEAEDTIDTMRGTFGEANSLATQQAKRVLILHDKMKEHCRMCDKPTDLCQMCWITEAIKKAGEV